MRKRNQDFNLKELINIFLPKLWIIIAVSLVFGAVMGSYSLFVKEDTYTSTTRIHVIKTDAGSDFAVSDVEFASSYLETYVEVLTIPDFLTQVLGVFADNHQEYESFDGEYEAKGWNKLTSGSIRGYISSSTKQDILTISVTTGNPYLSRGIADSIAKVFEESEFLAYPKDVVSVKTIQEPKIPTSANSRKLVLNTFIGLAVGAVLSMATVFVINMYDVVIHDKKKLEDNFDMPILGVIPRFTTDEGKNEK